MSSEPGTRSRAASKPLLAVLTVALAAVIGWVVFGSVISTSATDTNSGGPSPSSPPASIEPERALLEPAQVRDALNQGAIPVDVRTFEEYSAGHLKGAYHADISAQDFERSVTELDPDRTYVVYCASGNRAGSAIEVMSRLGFKHLRNGGGFTDLKSSGLIETE